MSAADDHGLVVRCQAGDPRAREELVIAYERIVYTVALRRTGDREEAHDGEVRVDAREALGEVLLLAIGRVARADHDADGRAAGVLDDEALGLRAAEDAHALAPRLCPRVASWA